MKTRATGDDAGPGRLALALLLAIGLHAALLLGIPANERPPSQRPTPTQFDLRMASPARLSTVTPLEPEWPRWLPPAPPKPRPAIPAAQPTQPQNAKSAIPPPVVRAAPKPPVQPVVKPALKPTPQAKPVPRPGLQPNRPLPKPAAPVPHPIARRPDAAEQHPHPAPVTRSPTSLDSSALLGQIAGLDREQQRKTAATVRTRRVSLTDNQSAAGFYAADWARKVMRIGEMNFPEAARHLATSTGPWLEVVIRADGHLQEVQVARSSGSSELDQAARRIVERAAPYPPFSAELRQSADVLRIEAPWRFDPSGRVRTR